jgi:hypothetical protein
MTLHDRFVLTGAGAPPAPAAVATGSQGVGPRLMRLPVAAGSALLAASSRALAVVKRRWTRVPRAVRNGVHAVLDATGVPYVLNYLAGYETTYQAANFAGNLIDLVAEYRNGTPADRERLADRFTAIAEALVMRNGVRKSTHPMRQAAILTKVLSDPTCRLRTAAIRVLDLPSSTGVAALDNFATLSRHYRIRDYVLGDLFWHVLYDVDRQCIFDEDCNLLQVKLKRRLFSIYRPARSGERYTALTRCWLLPFELMSRYLKAKYPYVHSRGIVPIRLLHPDVEAGIRAGKLTAKVMDVFKEIGDRYDVILCFNLLLRRYFPEDRIATGIQNLTHALYEHGLLILGDQESYAVAQKRGGKLVFLTGQARF